MVIQAFPSSTKTSSPRFPSTHREPPLAAGTRGGALLPRVRARSRQRLALQEERQLHDVAQIVVAVDARVPEQASQVLLNALLERNIMLGINQAVGNTFLRTKLSFSKFLRNTVSIVYTLALLTLQTIQSLDEVHMLHTLVDHMVIQVYQVLTTDEGQLGNACMYSWKLLNHLVI